MKVRLVKHLASLPDVDLRMEEESDDAYVGEVVTRLVDQIS